MKTQLVEEKSLVAPSNEPEACRFGVFELDIRALELWRQGRRCRLAPQPARILVHLVRRAGLMVTREELARALWGEGVHVDAEAGLNAAIRQVRQALGDDAASPRFVETLPRRGYRFIAPVTITAPATTTAPTTPPASATGRDAASMPAASPAPGARSRRRMMTGTVIIAVLAVLAVLALGGFERPQGDGNETNAASTLEAPSIPVSQAQPSPASAIAPPALDAYFKGRYILRSSGAQSGSRAAALFARALEIDPGAVPALAGLASARLRMTAEGVLEPATGLAMAFDEADRALAADPRLAEGWRVRARARWLGRWDWQGADADFAQAIAVAPNAAENHVAYAFFRSAAGDHDRALALMEEAAKIDPLSPAVNLDSAWLFFFARRYEEAITRATRALELDPTLFSAHYCLSASYERLGRPADASRHALAMTASAGGIATAGNERDAMLRWWREQAKADTPTFPHYDRALFALGQGELDQALADLTTSLERREAQITRLAVDPRLGSLAADARFRVLVGRLGGPDPLGILPTSPALVPANANPVSVSPQS